MINCTSINQHLTVCLQALFSIIASILHLGNVNFVDEEGELVLDDNGAVNKISSVGGQVLSIEITGLIRFINVYVCIV